MTLHHIANYLKLHYMTVYRLIKTRSLTAFRLGGDFRVRRSDLEKWIAQQHVPGRGKQLERQASRQGPLREAKAREVKG
jgi:excisionase family DNA binding protein